VRIGAYGGDDGWRMGRKRGAIRTRVCRQSEERVWALRTPLVSLVGAPWSIRVKTRLVKGHIRLL
jgi:hypothetical protein